jgi:(1->4)-alpha-D-glucan 1-alpha-D-glucosylmutase
LSELADDWRQLIGEWSRLLRADLPDQQRTAPPGRNDEYFFYQMLLGAWPVELLGGLDDENARSGFVQRIQAAMTKSLREAKAHSTWSAPNESYEEPTLAFIERALDPARSGEFLAAFLPFAGRIARLGARNTLVQTVLKLALPGLPDIYQGAELWDLSLVDPDNRRPVDYELRARLLEQVEAELEADPARAMGRFMRDWQDGRFKLAAITTLLRLRARRPELFQAGEYKALPAQGARADEICAFARRRDGEMLVTAAARFPARQEMRGPLSGVIIPLPDGAGALWRDALTGRSFRAGPDGFAAEELFAILPVAVLERSG